MITKGLKKGDPLPLRRKTKYLKDKMLIILIKAGGRGLNLLLPVPFFIPLPAPFTIGPSSFSHFNCEI